MNKYQFNNLKIRIGGIRDINILHDLLFEAVFWNPDMVRPDKDEFLKSQEISKIIAHWGREGDICLIAEVDGVTLGGAWYRFWTDDDHSYGFVDSDTPEIGISLFSEYRSKGIGRKLLTGLIDCAKSSGIKALSLSVDPQNFARQLYESVGFEKIGKFGTSYTYILRL